MCLFHNVFLVIEDDTDPLLYAVIREGNKVSLPHVQFVAVDEDSHHWRSIAASLGNNQNCYGLTKLKAVILDQLSCSRNLVYTMKQTEIICSDHFQCMTHTGKYLEWVRADLPYDRCYRGLHMNYIHRRILKELHDHLYHLPAITQVHRYHYPGHLPYRY
jgi:hypothetical protein